MSTTRLIRLAGALALGLAHAAAFAPLGLWWLQTLSLAGLLLLACGPGNGPAVRREAAFSGLAFGFAWFAAGVAWLYISMHRYGGMPWPLAGAAVALFALYLGAFAAATLAITAPVIRRALEPGLESEHAGARTVLRAAWLFAAVWSAGEMLRGWLFTGFPWLSSGYAHTDGPLAALAPVLGVYGIGAASALAAAGMATAIARIRTGRHESAGRAGLPAALACIAVPLMLGAALAPLHWAQETGEPLRVRLLQGNVPQQMKFDPARAIAAMQGYAAALAVGPADLFVLPETAWTVPWSRTPAPIAAAIEASLARNGAIAAIGMPLAARTASGEPTLSNSIAAIGPDGPLPWRYDKRHLVPFGEFVPTGFGWFVRLMQIPLGDFGRGAADQPALELRGQRLAFNICYEDIFGRELAPQVRAGATILVNASNLGWFGDSTALPQHLQIARMRSMEFARPSLSATNTGITAAIDSRGRVIGALAPFIEATLAVELRGSTGLTPYARAGELAPLALAALLAIAALALRPQGRRRAR